jgi:hypothetical protein
MKKLLMILSFVCLSTVGFAQGQGQQRGERPSTEETIKKATTELSLTDAQVTQWTEIYSKYEPAMKDRSTGREARAKMNEELEATLTKEQQEKYKAMRAAQRPPQRIDN